MSTAELREEVLNALLETALEIRGEPYVLEFSREDDSRPWEEGQEPESWSVDALELDAEFEQSKKTRQIVVGRTFVLPFGAYTPLNGDRLVLEGQYHTILSVEPFQPFGEALFYKITVGK